MDAEKWMDMMRCARGVHSSQWIWHMGDKWILFKSLGWEVGLGWKWCPKCDTVFPERERKLRKKGKVLSWVGR